MKLIDLKLGVRWTPLALALCGATLSTVSYGCGTADDEQSDEVAEDDLENGEARRFPFPWWRRDGGITRPTPSRDAGPTPVVDAGTPRPDASTPVADASTPPGHGGSDAGHGGTPTKSLWCEARTVFQDTCVSCHGKNLVGGAPMPLVDYADFTKAAPISQGKKVYEVVSSRVHDATRPMPPGRPLSTAQLALIDAWVKDGAKPGDDPTCAGTKPSEPKPEKAWPPPGSDKCYRITVDNDGKGQKQRINAGSEPHPQVILDAPWGNEDVQATGFKPITDNAKILHHWILYQNTAGMAFVTGWAPGQDESELDALPPDVGIYLPKGARSLRLDMHYFNKNGTQAEIDASGVEVCVTKPRKYAATTYMGFGNFLISLPPNKKTDVVGRCNVRVTQPVYLLTSSPHAHQLAYHMKFEVTRGTQKTVLHDGAFAFDGQTATNLDKPFELKTGDIVTTTCSFNNTTNRTVTFGENTGNEMCFNFATYYPKGALSCGLGF